MRKTGFTTGGIVYGIGTNEYLSIDQLFKPKRQTMNCNGNALIQYRIVQFPPDSDEEGCPETLVSGELWTKNRGPALALEVGLVHSKDMEMQNVDPSLVQVLSSSSFV